LGRDLGCFWYYWLWTTESVDGSIAGVTTSGATTTVTVRQDGEMPSPVVLRVEFEEEAPGDLPANATRVDATTVTYTWPVDVWFPGSRTFDAVIGTGGASVARITFDPGCRFPDRDPWDNEWSEGGLTTAACSGLR
jgi:hypothetical protein